MFLLKYFRRGRDVAPEEEHGTSLFVLATDAQRRNLVRDHLSAARAAAKRVCPAHLLVTLEELQVQTQLLQALRCETAVVVHVQEVHKRLLETGGDREMLEGMLALDTAGEGLEECTYGEWARGWAHAAGPDRTFHVTEGSMRVVPKSVAKSEVRKKLDGAAEECPVCFEAACDVVSACGHGLCDACVARLPIPRCPVCREEPVLWYGGPQRVATVVSRLLNKLHLSDRPVLVFDESFALGTTSLFLREPRVLVRATLTGAAVAKFRAEPVVVVAHENASVAGYAARYLRVAHGAVKVYACLLPPAEAAAEGAAAEGAAAEEAGAGGR